MLVSSLAKAKATKARPCDGSDCYKKEAALPAMSAVFSVPINMLISTLVFPR